MFYSHETTIGAKSSAKKVTRKAIQEVDVSRACEKILDPGAPIALRLQGSLLYGVSNVYNQQCGYMLADTQKMQNAMMTYLKRFSANQLDPEAGQARRENLVIQDDPNFIPHIPDIVLDDAPPIFSQHTNKTSSQMSPHQSLLSGGSSSGNDRFSVQLDPHPFELSDPHGLQGLSSAQKPAGMGGGDDFFDLEEGDDGLADHGIQIDEFGNMIETGEPVILGEEPELPPHRIVEDNADAPQPDQQGQMDEQGDVVMMDEQPLPDAEALPPRQQQEEEGDPLGSDDQVPQAAPPQRRRQRRFIQSDEDTTVSRGDIKSWQDDYVENCCVPKPHIVTLTQARRNAMLLTFGLGLGDIGANLGVPGMVHPLAMQFSGDALFTAYTGLEVLENARSGRKRTNSASQSMEEDEEEAARRIRPRLSIEPEQEGQGRGVEMNDVMFDLNLDEHQSPPEVGREAQSAMSEHLSSALPWNRGSSQIPSSARGPNLAQPGREQSSPLGNRGSVQDIQRYSDDMPEGGDQFDFGGGGFHSADDSFGGMPPPAVAEQTRSQMAFNREGANFLTFMENTILENGERRHDEDYERRRKWIDFDDIFVPIRTDRYTAAQAFYHVLTLATKNKLLVEQDNGPNEPFGSIHVGMRMLAI